MPEIELSRRPEAMATACDRVEQIVRDAGWTEKDVSRVALAVGEAVANAVEHGGGALDSPVRLSLDLSGSTLTVRVADGGEGPPPDRVASARLPAVPLATEGRGLYIQTRLADRLHVDSEGGVVLTFERRP